tara:strand:- start:211 stop:555 length:345 start_codon:yes stop_codon:yes gene_type:complete
MKTNTFRLHPLNEENYVIVIFNVEEKNGKYYISFKYKFEDLDQKIECNIMKKLNLYDKELDIYYEGDIIHINSLTKELVSYMLLSEKELEKHSGRITSECYRLNLINMIKLLWD